MFHLQIYKKYRNDALANLPHGKYMNQCLLNRNKMAVASYRKESSLVLLVCYAHNSVELGNKHSSTLKKK